MIIPIKCLSCGKVIANLWKTYTDVKEKYASSTQEKLSEELLKAIKLKRICCKRMLLSHVEIIDELIKYK